MRIQSPRAAGGNAGGWFHALDAHPTEQPEHWTPPTPQPTIDALALMAGFAAATTRSTLVAHAITLGVSPASLDAIGCAWAARHGAFAFPMRDSAGATVGIRLRSTTGAKWAVAGSRAGLFYGEPFDRVAWIIEGPTDTAAAITLGLTAIGRPSCLGSEGDTNRLLHRWGCREAVIISDNDGPGYRGAERLALSLTIPSCLIVLPCKDIREFLRAGGTRQDLACLLSGVKWTRPPENQRNFNDKPA